MTTTRRTIGALAWLAAAIAIALGAAGLVTAMDAPPSGGSRPELTSGGDAEVTPVLDEAEAALADLAEDVDALGAQARAALAALNGTDLETVEAAVASGDEIIERIRRTRLVVAATLAEVPRIGTPEAGYTVSPAVVERHGRLHDALASTDHLEGAWARLTTGSVAASRLGAELAAHDEAVLAAAEHGRDAEYEEAIETLDDADAAIAAARELRDRLAATVDVSTLDEWLDRNAEYDVALRRLYAALQDVGGRVTADVREAIDAERVAAERLPPDARGLVVIMAEIGRGGMNSAVIAIEEARGRLAEALSEPGALSPTPPP